MARIGIIAGAGEFPLHVAQAARAQGHWLCAIALKQHADASIARHVDAIEWTDVGQLSQLLRICKRHALTQAVMAGQVTKGALLNPRIAFDPESLQLLARARDMRVNSLLGAVGERLARDGVELLNSAAFLADWLPAPGTLTRRRPSEAQWEDIHWGAQAARTLASLDVGLTVVVQQQVVLAVEALEGTNAAIRRGAALGQPGVVVVKMARPAQDLRFDLPVIGPQTMQALIETRAACLAVEARTTLLLSRPALIAQADAAGLMVVAIEPPRDAPTT